MKNTAAQKAAKAYATKAKVEMAHKAILMSLGSIREKDKTSVIQELMEICFKHGYEQASVDITGKTI